MLVSKAGLLLPSSQVRHTAGHGSWNTRLKASRSEIRIDFEIHISADKERQLQLEGSGQPPRVAGPYAGIQHLFCLPLSSCFGAHKCQPASFRFARFSPDLLWRCSFCRLCLFAPQSISMHRVLTQMGHTKQDSSTTGPRVGLSAHEAMHAI